MHQLQLIKGWELTKFFWKRMSRTKGSREDYGKDEPKLIERVYTIHLPPALNRHPLVVSVVSH